MTNILLEKGQPASSDSNQEKQLTFSKNGKLLHSLLRKYQSQSNKIIKNLYTQYFKLNHKSSWKNYILKIHLKILKKMSKSLLLLKIRNSKFLITKPYLELIYKEIMILVILQQDQMSYQLNLSYLSRFSSLKIRILGD